MQNPRQEVGPNGQRRMANFLLQPSLQLRLPAYFLLITIGFGMVLAVAVTGAYRNLYETVAAEQPAYVEQILHAQTQDFILFSSMIAIGYLLTVLVVSVVHSHRMVGPSVALRRHVEALKNGDFSARVALRRKDAFGDLAEDLNELAMLLEYGEKHEGSD
jgi:methyl-accepting chemotaxis protein